jgi:hypothetical protein
MNWLSLLGVFAKPLGALINNGLAAGATALIAWSVSKGIDQNLATTVVGSLVLAISSAISGLAATQGVQIPVINNDANNGVKVVKAEVNAPAVDAPQPPKT